MAIADNKRPRSTGRSRTTISDLAAHLGMAKGTVSRALNDYPDIAEGTRLRVRRAADALGYRPLAHAQAIRTGRVRSVGLVLQVNEHDGHRPFLADFLAGISEAASTADWTMTLATAASDQDTLRLMSKLADEQKADGFILPRTYLEDTRVSALLAGDVPFVLFGRTGDPRGCAWFDIESEAAMTEAVLRLAKLGHTRIGFVPGGPGYTYATLRRQGYLEGLKQAGLSFHPALISEPALNRVDGELAAQKLLSLDVPPTALVCSVDRAAFGAYDAAAALGLEIGKDLSVISYDGMPEGALLSPPLSTFSVDLRHAGARLTELLIRRIRGEAVEDLRDLAKARFLDRGSHGPPTRTPAELAHHVKHQWFPTGGRTK